MSLFFFLFVFSTCACPRKAFGGWDALARHLRSVTGCARTGGGRGGGAGQTSRRRVLVLAGGCVAIWLADLGWTTARGMYGQENNNGLCVDSGDILWDTVDSGTQ